MRIDKNTTIRLGDRNIVKVKLGDVVIWQKNSEPVVEPEYFYIESLTDGNTVTLNTSLTDTSHSQYLTPTVQFSTNKQNWTTVTFDWSTTGDKNIDISTVLNTGDKMYFRNDTGKFNYVNSGSSYSTIKFSTTKNANAGGDIRTLANYRDVETSSMTKGMFSNLFNGNTYIVDASNLRLPFTTLTDFCYYRLFYGCTSLTTAPALPAKTLTTNCYQQLFYGCTSLTTAPALPATTLANYCYYQLFYGCSKLTTAPALPATTLLDSCYNGIFKNCSSLNTVKISAKNISATNCLTEWLYGCAKTGTVYNLGKVNIPYFTDSGIRRGWVECNYSDKHSDDYFWFKNTYNGSNNLHITREINGSPSSSNYTTTVEWSKDKKNWTKMTIGSSNSISLAKNETVYLRNDTGKFSYFNGNGSARCYYKISGDYSCTVGGDLRTLINYKNVVNLSLKNGVFAYLFYYDSKITSASSLTFKYHTISSYGLFQCFDGDESLTAAPSVLHPVNINPYCYYRMYTRTNIRNTPILPAQTLKESCYVELFTSCNDFSSVTSYANNISATSCLENWMKSVKSSGTFHNLGTASYPRSASGVPSGWTIVKN